MAPDEPKDRDLTKKRDEKSEELKDLSAKKVRQEEEEKVKGGGGGGAKFNVEQEL